MEKCKIPYKPLQAETRTWSDNQQRVTPEIFCKLTWMWSCQWVTHTQRDNSQPLQGHSHNSWLPLLVPGMNLGHTHAQADWALHREKLKDTCLGLEGGISSSQSNNKLQCSQHKESTRVGAGWGRMEWREEEVSIPPACKKEDIIIKHTSVWQMQTRTWQCLLFNPFLCRKSKQNISNSICPQYLSWHSRVAIQKPLIPDTVVSCTWLPVSYCHGWASMSINCWFKARTGTFLQTQKWELECSEWGGNTAFTRGMWDRTRGLNQHRRKKW